tara:strand:+ start:1281 stop:1457 length:177 start_codon:yes stop_codon:yes gene_type:complete
MAKGKKFNRVKALIDEIEQGINVEENKAELFQVYGMKLATGGKIHRGRSASSSQEKTR